MKQNKAIAALLSLGLLSCQSALQTAGDPHHSRLTALSGGPPVNVFIMSMQAHEEMDYDPKEAEALCAEALQKTARFSVETQEGLQNKIKDPAYFGKIPNAKFILMESISVLSTTQHSRREIEYRAKVDLRLIDVSTAQTAASSEQEASIIDKGWRRHPDPALQRAALRDAIDKAAKALAESPLPE